ncbi:PREDICTED: uncharacterized protein LOC104598052 isoform X1 [Nelumbo nucifera]|uniref:Uncharacterized protein LOC104598052 isoform X1 n=1 Tax=Nelumbo nucifera TaxID=4432 RepID=A0A1U7ZV10_NELNU|nr:PREDICTED: uncharacterized protein LOC104598052 isoform X1 [Nelumbo nucifera]XP_019053416.1 PREDICTED: uncharacterized protein LOC104598052 isoform X1 [Nelumbo nucifera]
MIHIQTTEGVQSKIPIPLSRTLILEPEDGWAAFQMQELEPQLIKEKSQETVISKLPLDPYTPSSSGHKPAKKDTSGVFPWEETFENLSPAGSELLLAVLPFYNHCQRFWESRTGRTPLPSSIAEQRAEPTSGEICSYSFLGSIYFFTVTISGFSH